MNNISTSECGSGCESGWTTYWAQLSNSTNPNYNKKLSTRNIENEYFDDDDDDDDLSMVSDASSGPRPNINDDHCSSFSGDKKTRSKRENETRQDKKHSQFCLDDTATSPFFHFYQDNVFPDKNHYSPVRIFEMEPTPKKQLGFHKSSRKGKSGKKEAVTESGRRA